MPTGFYWTSVCALGLLWQAWLPPAHAQSTTENPAAVSFAREIRPILSENCFACHGFDQAAREADLRLDTRAGALGEDGGTVAIVPGRPQESELLRRVLAAADSEVMPPAESGKQLTAKDKELLARWIAQGAAYAQHWAFALPQPPEPPVVEGSDHPLDGFIQSRLAAEGLQPAPAAEPATLIRRLSLDLIGLPPTIAEVDAYLAAYQHDAEQATDELVERLLSSPHYGERWGRWWLDQARYADSNGYSIDAPREIWKYRDWVIEAFNTDMPFDRFTIEQLAGDLLPDATESQRVATGFHRNTQINQEGGIDKEQFRVDSVFDRVATTGTVWLGLSIGCAQCHDHKFDPITQVEYYQMFAFFNNQDEPSLRVYGPDVDPSQLKQQWQAAERALNSFLDEQRVLLAAWEAELSDEARQQLPSGARQALAVELDKRKLSHWRALFAAAEPQHEQFAELQRHYDRLDQQYHHAPTTLVLQERAKPRTTTVFIKGDFTRPADEVVPGTPAVLHPFEPPAAGGNRLDLARWLTSPRNPLMARVIVNRIWQQYFGRGLVETENDFGLQGASPSHPELLDWLAVEFMRGGWSIKDIHRLIVSSHTYRQSSSERPELRERDPRNYWLARQQRLRLEAEVVRDVGLAISGLFTAQLGGPPVFPPIPDGVMGQGQVQRSWKVSSGQDRYRRGLYTFVFRATPPPSLNVFDAPEGLSTCTRRIRSNTPLQALTLLNDPAFFEFATELEKIISRDGMAVAFRRCTARQPSAEELEALTSLDTLTAARVLLNLDETITRE